MSNMTSGRLAKYLSSKNISVYSLENTIGASRGAIAKAINDKKGIGSNFVENILIHYPDLNPEWLLTGEGEMLKSSQLQTSQGAEDNDTLRLLDSQLTHLQAENKELKAENKELNKQIGRLEGRLDGKDEVIGILKEELRLLKKDSQTQIVRGAKRAVI